MRDAEETEQQHRIRYVIQSTTHDVRPNENHYPRWHLAPALDKLRSHLDAPADPCHDDEPYDRWKGGADKVLGP